MRTPDTKARSSKDIEPNHDVKQTKTIDVHEKPQTEDIEKKLKMEGMRDSVKPHTNLQAAAITLADTVVVTRLQGVCACRPYYC